MSSILINRGRHMATKLPMPRAVYTYRFALMSTDNKDDTKAGIAKMLQKYFPMVAGVGGGGLALYGVSK